MNSNPGIRTSIRVALSVPFPPKEVAEYLFRDEIRRYWLSDDSELTPNIGFRAVLPHAVFQNGRLTYSGHVRGDVTSLAWPRGTGGTASGAGPDAYEIGVSLHGSAGQVVFRLTPCPEGSCRLRTEHSGHKTAEEAHASVRMWQGALNRIDRLMRGVIKALRRERQAVIVVHGVGEQRPGQLLRQFVSNVFDRAAGEVHFVKPDYVSSSFEMRMVTVPRVDSERPTTDVYELYWAHLIRDTTVAQVYGWILRLMISKDAKIPRSLLRGVWALRVFCVAALAFTAWAMTKDVSAWLTGLGLGSLAALPAIAKVGLGLVHDEYVVGYAGDAARYLEPRAENIGRRQEIREAGVQLLEALHDQGRYARIVLYGHSLGSVIAYDMLTHTWARRSRRRQGGPNTCSRALMALEDLLNPRVASSSTATALDVQPLQHAAWHEYRQNGFDWRVSDFVTAGSPLSHAQWLLNLDDRTQFADLVRERSFPSCPPQTEAVRSPVPGKTRHAFTFTHAYEDDRNIKRKRSVQVPHHGGVFALTRWTNLYFPYSGLKNGDPIAGPLAGLFGSWVRDIALPGAEGFAHSRYTARKQDAGAVEHVRAALNLPFRSPLTMYGPADLQPTRLA